MNSLIADSESAIRLAVFFSILLALSLLEFLFPRRQLQHSKLNRWLNNFGISLFNTILTRALLPIVGVGAALYAEDRGWGLLNIFSVSAWVSILVFILLFDLTIYFQHRLFHAVPLLWRLHRMHHTDVDYDISTGNRFHPVSILLSSLIKLGLIFLLGPLPIAVIMAEVLLNGTSMFNHSNVRIPKKQDRLIRYLVVTPDMHRVHHSTNQLEQNRNFGFNFSWWDRLFGTYMEQPHLGHEAMKIGIEKSDAEKSVRIDKMLLQPLHD